ncbi:MAG: carbamoyltransferase HypF [Phycisphaeraceae bacterium]|nr:carbamoyltransferase HypF [Phycisphaeraceae bacterium]
MGPASLKQSDTTRRRWSIRGQVQGVGFRPFVYRLAYKYRLQGFVRNDANGVTIEAQGPAPQLERFAHALEGERPALATFEHVDCETVPIDTTERTRGFRIEASRDDGSADPEGPPSIDADVTIDTAVCPDCVRELHDPEDPRHAYGLINCTHCGPRFTIIRRVPYDRSNTTMASFRMCDACGAQYRDPLDRRFHAQPIACHDCGPQVELVDPQGAPIDVAPIEGACRRLEAGRIVAIKGLGGFHLAARPDDEAAVARLRRLKHRDHKPFALMCRSIDDARRLVRLSDAAAQAMRSPRCPIVLAPKHAGGAIADAVAMDNHRLGVMLPYTPIHHLLFDELDGAIRALVMTSGNERDEPLVIRNQEAVDRLATLCDAVLRHDRPIERCVDDSVVLDLGADGPLPIRRARGDVPSTLPLPDAGDSHGLCVGGELKNTIAIVRGDRAVLSQHLGDLTHPLAFAYFRKAVDDLHDLLGARPAWIAHDPHPMYLSTVHARTLARQWEVPLVPVQHHHAHAAAVMAEHGISDRILAVVCDGVGYGGDGTIWGGELLMADLFSYQRVAHLRPLRLPGGDAAARDTRRCGLALLYQAYGETFDQHPASLAIVPDDAQRGMLAGMIRRDFNCADSSGAGRVFDGVAALLGLCCHNEYEAQAAMSLEAAATACPVPQFNRARFQLSHGAPTEIDLAPLVRALVSASRKGLPVEELAALFHDQFAWAWSDTVIQWGRRTDLRHVALSGGVFCNERLTRTMTDRLTREGFRVLRHHEVPPNDGGLSLGQAAVAAARVRGGRAGKENAPCALPYPQN